VILSPSFLRGSASSTPVFAEMGKTVKSSHWKNVEWLSVSCR
jgi:hypothetical protein